MTHYPRTDRRCGTCLRFPDFTGRSMFHWRACVPRKDWPEFTEPVLAATAAVNVCEACGFVAASAFGLMAHQRSHARAVIA